MDEVFTFEEREYVNPEVSLNEQMDFVDKYRALQNQSQAQINRDTQALGTQVPSSMGGLSGAENLWTTQYRTPQVNAAVENLKQAAQMSALNTALANQQGMWQNRYNQAERAYNRAKIKRDYTPSTTNGNDGNVNFGDDGSSVDNASLTENIVVSSAPGTTVLGDGDRKTTLSNDPQGGTLEDSSWGFTLNNAFNAAEKRGDTVLKVTPNRTATGYSTEVATLTVRDKFGKVKDIQVWTDKANTGNFFNDFWRMITGEGRK